MSKPMTPKGDEWLWGILVQQSGVGVAVFDVDGRCLFANPEALKMFLGDPHFPLVGRRLAEIHSPDFSAAAVQSFRDVAQSGRPLILRMIRGGKQLQTTLWAMPSPAGARHEILAITRVGESDPEARSEPIEIREFPLADLGPLDPLTPRELEVLALLGQGLNIPQIAATLHRSRRTIERHRDAIAKKLQTTERVKLARLAAEAGLQVRDATLKRDR